MTDSNRRYLGDRSVLRVAATVFVVAMVVLAGCGGGGQSTTAASGDEAAGADGGDGGDGGDGADGDSSADGDSGTSTMKPASAMDEEPPGVEDGKLENASKLTSAFDGQTQGQGSVINLTIQNSTGADTSLLIKNDTENQLYQYSEGDNEMSYYITPDSAAVRNGTTGEVKYGQRYGQAAAFLGFILFVPFSFVGVMEWEASGVQTVDGTDYLVMESDTINQTKADQSDFTFSNGSQMDTTEGRMLISADGEIRSMSITLSGTNNGQEVTVDISLTVRSGGDISVEQPSWVDEGELNNATTPSGEA